MLKVRIAALILGILLPSAAMAQPASTGGPDGIWEGTIGTLPIRACFVQRDGSAFGAYYYLSHFQLVALQREEGASGGYSEGAGDPGAALWRNVEVRAGNLTARWTSGSRTLPVRLHRVAGGGGEEGACASVAFHQPRLAGIRTVTARATAEGVAYTKLTLDTRDHFGIEVETFALDGDSAAVRRINATLGESLAGNPPHWLECITGSLDNSGFEGEASESLTPAMISRRWLSVASSGEWSCGGAHPDSSSTYRLFDLTSGAEVELLDWFLPAAVKRETFEGSAEVSKTLEPAFRTFILTDWHPDADAAECDEVVRSQDFWNVGLTREGFVFSPSLPHVVQACGDNFFVDFDRIQPWLTPQAAEQVRALRAEPAASH
jgi:hypothetical protein